MKTIIIHESIIVGASEVLEDVDPIILMEMRERLSPSKPFSYADGDHDKGHELEKRMRDKSLNKTKTRLKSDINQN